MKKLVCIMCALMLMLSCAPVYADAFTDLFGAYTHMDATLDRTTNDCIVKPKQSAFTEYAAEGKVILPYFAKNGDILMLGVVMHGDESLKKPCNVMIVTDKHKYRLDLNLEKKKKAEMGTADIDGKEYNMFLLPTDAVDMCADIAQSGSVTVRFSKDSSYMDKHEFVMNKEVQACFGAAYEAYMKYDAVLDNALMDMVMNMTANQYLNFKKEANASSMWD